MTALSQKREALKAARVDAGKLVELAGKDLDFNADGVEKLAGRKFDSGTQYAEFVNQKWDEIDELQNEVTSLNRSEKSSIENEAALKAVESGFKHPGSKPESKEFNDDLGLKGYTSSDIAAYKGQSVGEAVVRSLIAKAEGSIYGLNNRGDTNIDLPVKMIESMIMKTDMTTAAGWAPEDIRIPGFVEIPTRPAPRVINILPTFPTSMSTILYMLQSTRTNNSAEAAENAALAEAAMVFTETSSEVRKIGQTLPVTVEQLEDVAGLRAILDQQMGNMLAQRLDLQVMVGNGTAPNISGFHDRTSINAQAKGTDSALVALNKGATAVQVTGFADPDNYVLHPTDWQTIRLSQTADGAFLFGPPSVAVAPLVWGLPVTVSTAETAGQALVGDFSNFSALYMRRGVTITVTDSHASEFLDDVLRIKATMRAALAVFREEAFTEITGL